ncbi:MAG: NDP-sugar synthase [Candidatus Gastranaerophilales bacterium]|nr:NDP-sugar synthase [Candidatus Gastranaerophilales bacterium]
MVKKAMIMAAGVGSRLDPLTQNIPKPLVPIANIPPMDILLKNLSKSGIKNIIANTFYLGDKINEKYRNSDIDCSIEFLNETELSGTAGGVKKCQFFFDKNEDFIVMSADGVTDINIIEAINAHKSSDAIATMVTKNVDKNEVNKFGVVVIDDKGFIQEFQEKPSITEAKSTLINTGIYIFKYEIFNFIPKNTTYDFAKNVFPNILANGIKINTYTTDCYWSDIGSLEQYIESTHDILNKKITIPDVDIEITSTYKLVKGKNTFIADNVTLLNDIVIGDNCYINGNVTIDNSIIWNNVKIKPNVQIKNCIIDSGAIVNQSIENEIFECKELI